MISLLYRRPDGSFVASINGMPYHVIEDDPLFEAAQQAAADLGDALPLEPPPPEPEPDQVTVVYPVDLWSRMTDVEADAVEAAMTTQPVRIQNIFRAASSYRSDHELWPLLETVAVGLFGAERAAEILAAS